MGSRSTPLRAPSLAEELYDAIRADILAGDRKPGDRLGEAELSRQFGISQAPVRDALARLAADGLAVQYPRRGTYVASVTNDEARITYAIRRSLEPLAVKLAMANLASGLIDDLRVELDGMNDSAKNDDVNQFVEHDMAFHRRVWDAADATMLTGIWGLIEVKIRSFMLRTNLRYYDNLTEIADLHPVLLDALLSGDDDAAGQLFATHCWMVWLQFDREGEPDIAPPNTPSDGRKPRR